MDMHLRPLAHTDERGTIVDIVQDTPVEHATVVTFEAGAVRGNHYHKHSTQYTYVLSGRLLVASRHDGTVEVIEASAGALIVHHPEERHRLTALEPSVILVLTRGPRGGTGYESDTFREVV